MSDSEDSVPEDQLDASDDQCDHGSLPLTHNNHDAHNGNSAATHPVCHPVCQPAPPRWALDYELKAPLEYRGDPGAWERQVRLWVRAREPLLDGDLLLFVTSVEQVEERWVLFGVLCGPDDALPDPRNGRGSAAVEVLGADAYFRADLPDELKDSWSPCRPLWSARCATASAPVMLFCGQRAPSRPRPRKFR